jgi:ATP-dependent Lhr-like helicase
MHMATRCQPDPLSLFLPAVQEWFRTALGEPTPPQRQGWPIIAAGANTLILAPTGSGKTLAAFLACLDQLWRQPVEKGVGSPGNAKTPDPFFNGPPRGVRVLYVSPLKALNNDIHRNLQIPLAGVMETATRMGHALPTLEVGLRSGDTPTAERQRLVRKPPHVLITTPESLHLMLTSKARDTLRGVTHCIVDEIHALCPNKRGVFLALLLERLQALNPRGFVRIGLSATQRPLDVVARFLGGCEANADGRYVPRPVTIVDAGQRKSLDLRVVSPVARFGPLPEKSVWPSIYRLLGDEVRKHRSTLIFTNNRRVAERITANLNDPEPIARAHHGSVALEVRQQTEQALKEGRLPAVVATASLELGIDMGAVDLVCQVESPGSVARGLQRVGRAGHLVGQTSKGRLIPKTSADLLEQAVLAREMTLGNVEEIRVPGNCLDVLAQQVVALAAMDVWDVPALFALVRQAYPYRDLSPQAFETVLEMVSGRFRFGDRPMAALQPRVSWDRVHNRLHALPGSQQTALVSGGTIPDTGQYAAYTRSGVRIGELDEEFIYERRVGDSFLLGTNAWRLERIDADRVIVNPAEGAPALVPFWHGERAGRSYHLGLAIGRSLRELTERLDDANCTRWLEDEFQLDANAAKNLRAYVRRQLAATGTLPTDQTLFIEAFRDQLGDWQVLLLSPLGSSLHLSLRLAIEARLRQRHGYGPQCLHADDGVLVRLADMDEPVLDLLDGITPENVEALILDELGDSALFALRFRQNAARALLLPRISPGKRAPLWLQRLRGRDLLQVARKYPDFPIVAETFRECLHDHLDLPRLQQLLGDLRDGKVRVATRRADAPSPFAATLLFGFTMANMYGDDGPEAERTGAPLLDRQLLEQLVTPGKQGHLLDARAVYQVERRLRGIGQPPRTSAEMAEWLRRLGDLSANELEGPMQQFLEQLESDGRAKRIELPHCRESLRWVSTEEEERYRHAFGLGNGSASESAAAETILRRFLETHALVGLTDVLDRYPFEPDWARRKLEEWAGAGRLIAVRRPVGPGGPTGPAAAVESETEWSIADNLAQVQRSSLSLLRREIITCSPTQFTDFLLRWQGVHPEARRGQAEGLIETLDRLEGFPLPAELWEHAVLPARVAAYQPRWLDDAAARGEWTWVCSGASDGAGALAFWRRESLAALPPPADQPTLSPAEETALEYLRGRGASFVGDIARETQAPPTAVRASLWGLLRRGLVTNDHFDVIRKGEEKDPSLTSRERERPELASHSPLSHLRGSPGRGLSPRATLSSLRRRAASTRPEGRWSLVPWGHPEAEQRIVFQAVLLLHRYGIVARELALLDPTMPPWRILYEVFSRMELAGDVRRGYFVEGLSGAQFALPEAARKLQELHLPSTVNAPVILLHSLDPANPYGAGAPLAIDALSEGARAFARRPGNWLVLRAGRPVLLIEQQGKRLTALPSASREDAAAAVACLPNILTADRTLSGRRKLTVDEWNGRPVVETEGRDLLESAGFVRDYQGMTLYTSPLV